MNDFASKIEPTDIHFAAEEVVNAPQKKGFFARVAEWFSKGKENTPQQTDLESLREQHGAQLRQAAEQEWSNEGVAKLKQLHKEEIYQSSSPFERVTIKDADLKTLREQHGAQLRQAAEQEWSNDGVAKLKQLHKEELEKATGAFHQSAGALHQEVKSHVEQPLKVEKEVINKLRDKPTLQDGLESKRVAQQLTLEKYIQESETQMNQMVKDLGLKEKQDAHKSAQAAVEESKKSSLLYRMTGGRVGFASSQAVREAKVAKAAMETVQNICITARDKLQANADKLKTDIGVSETQLKAVEFAQNALVRTADVAGKASQGIVNGAKSIGGSVKALGNKVASHDVIRDLKGTAAETLRAAGEALKGSKVQDTRADEPVVKPSNLEQVPVMTARKVGLEK